MSEKDETIQLQLGNHAPAKVESKDELIFRMARELDVDKLQKVIDMWNAQEERKAQQDFDFHFADMQREFPEVQAKRIKQGHNYKYAPIEVLTEAYGPVIAKHGFSFRWGKERALEGAGKQSVLIISGWGHREEITFDIPKLDGTAQMNSIQVAGAMSTYGRRYTFLSGFGITVEDEDNDGTYDEALQYSSTIIQIREVGTLAILHDLWQEIYQQFKGDARAIKILQAEYNKKKKELANERSK